MVYRSESSLLPETGNETVEMTNNSKKPTFRSYVHREAPIPPSAVSDFSFVEDYFGNSLSAIGSSVPSGEKEVPKSPTLLSSRARPQPVRRAPDPPPPRPPRGQKLPLPPNNLIDL